MTKPKDSTANERHRRHVAKAKQAGGKRQSILLSGEAVEADKVIRKLEGDKSTTAVVNRLLLEQKNRLLR